MEAASDKIWAMIQNLKMAIDKIDRKMVGDWVHDLVVIKTFTGLRFQEAILAKVAAAEEANYRLALPEEEAQEGLLRMYLKSVRFLLWVVLPILVLLFSIMPQFLTLWLGSEFGGQSVWSARFLVLAQMFYILTTMPSTAAFSRKPAYMPAMVWSQAVISLLAWKALIPRYELLGVALGSLAAQAVPACVYLMVVHRRLIGLSLRRYWAQGLYAPVMSAAILLASVFPFHDQATNWPRLVGLVACGYAIFYGSTWFFMDADDRTLLTRFLRWEKPA